MKNILVSNFSKGMTADIRTESSGYASLLKHFDILSRPHSLTPYHSQVTADTSADSHRIRNFLYYSNAGDTANLWGLGGADTNPFATVYYKSDLTSTTWSQTANNTLSGRAINNVFVEYHDLFYGIKSNGRVWEYDPAGSNMDEDAASGVIQVPTNLNDRVPNGVVHSKDDVLYMAVGNVIAANNNGSWNRAALTLPSKYYISCMCEYNNYLAIACAPYGVGKSVVFLWDRDSSVTTLSESLDFGVGQLRIIEQIEGELIGISVRQDPVANLPCKIIFHHYNGGIPIIYREIIASSDTGLQLLYGQKFNANRLYFLAGIELEGTLHNGIWCTGRNSNDEWIVWMDTLPNNDDAITDGGLAGFIKVGDYACISYCSSPNGTSMASYGENLAGSGWGTGYSLTMTTNSTSSYDGSSIVETTINPDMPIMERRLNKQLQILAPSYSPIPAGGQMVIKWRVDGGDWQTARTETTEGRVVSEISANEGSFSPGREYQFRIESTGGVVSTGLQYKYEALNSLLP